MDLQARIAHTIATADPANVLSANDLGFVIANTLATAGVRGVDVWDVVALLHTFYDAEENSGEPKDPDAMAAAVIRELDLDA